MVVRYLCCALSARTWIVAAFVCMAGLTGAQAQTPPAEPPQEGLHLSQVLARVLRDSPELSVFPYQVRAAEARVLQAGLRANPEFSVEVENILGDGEFSGTNSAEITLALSQTIELGGKRRNRRAVAQLEGEIVQRDYELARLNVLAEAAELFLEIAQNQQLLQLAEQAFEWAQNAERSVETRLQAGGASRAELSQAKIEALQAQLAISEMRNRLEMARLQLAAQWGAEQADFTRVQADLFNLPQVPAFEQLRAQLEQSPQLQQYLTLDRLRQAQLDLAIAQGRQDINVGLGVKRFEATGDQALTFGFSMPLGIRDRNQGEISAARAELEGLGRDRTITRIHLYGELQRMYREMQQAALKVELLQQQALPAATDALLQAEQGYRNGRFSYLQLIEIRRQRLAVAQEAIEAAVVFHGTLLALEQLTGESLTATPQSIIIKPNGSQPNGLGRDQTEDKLP